MTVKISEDMLRGLLLRREDCSHKGDYGHLLLVCGCDRMPGAALLAVGSALKSGCGLVTLHSTLRACSAAAVAFPSAMLSPDGGECFSELPADLSKFSCIAAGPGIGRSACTASALAGLMREAGSLGLPMLLDADALNIIASDKALSGSVPAGSVMTPHDGELARLTGYAPGGDRDACASALAAETGCTVVAKGFHTRVFAPDGRVFENTVGNPGMAKGGSGDVLSGLIAGLMARGYSGTDAALLGVWIHGFAGDCLTRTCTAEAYSSRDLIDVLYKGFVELYESR